MPTLSSSLVKHQVASMEDVEEAMSRQVQYGGDLVTNLLELASVSEERLTRLLAENHGLEPAPIGELPTCSDGVRRLVPRDLAERYALYPLEERNGELAVAVSEPLPAEVESDMGFSLGVTVVQRLAPLVRVRQAIARDYGVALDQRSERVLSRLGGKLDAESVPPPLADASGLTGIRPATLAPPEPLRTPVVPKLDPVAEAATEPEPPSAAEPAAEAATPPSEPVSAAPPPRPTVMPNLAAIARSDERKPRGLHRGPYTAADAEKDLLGARSRDDVLQAFFDFASQYFDYAALFAVHGDLAEGRDAHGPGASRAKVSSIGVPLDLPSALNEARDAPTYSLARLGNDGLDGALIKDLERRPGRQIMLVPVRVRSRCVLILYGDHGDTDVLLENVGDVLSLVPLVSAAVERLILLRKGHAPDAVTPVARMQRPKRHSLPGPEARAHALASALGGSDLSSSRPPPEAPKPSAAPATSPVPARSPLPARVQSSPAPARVQSSPAPARVQSSPAPARVESSPAPARSPLPPRAESSPAPPRVASSPPPAAVRAPRLRPEAPDLSPEQNEESQPPSSIAEALSRPRVPLRDEEEAPDDAWDAPEVGTKPGVGGSLDRRIWKTAAEVDAEATSEPARDERVPTDFDDDDDHDEDEESHASPRSPKPNALPPSSASQRLQLVPDEQPDLQVVEELTDEDIDDAWREERDETPSSRIEVYEARPLPPRGNSSELKLPSVIIDMANDCRVLLEHLLAGDETAGTKLVEIGTAAVTVLVNAFPGPLKQPSVRPGSEVQKASECGPVLRTLLRLGSKSVPFLVVRTNDADPQVRRWATHLLGELPSHESVHAVARRFFDTDEEVKRGAVAASRLLLSHPEYGPALVAEFGTIAQDDNKAQGMRLAAIEAMAEVRHPLCVPELIQVLTGSPAEIKDATRRALRVVSRQDFGNNAATWAEWWRINGGRHRIEWLIDGLTHESQDLRRAAGEELKALTREYFGYYDDLPPRERERAQLRYREWWETRGKARLP